MRQLTQAGEQAVNELARRHGFSAGAVATMLDAVTNGQGSMAQFSHPEFGGSGQWMRGGMTMIGDMFNTVLKSRVDVLCADLAALLASQPDLVRTGSFQSQSQGGYSQPQGSSPASLFVPAGPGGAGNWWGDDLAWPTSTGAQNNSRYAYFAQARRLAVDVNGTVTIHDTLDHAIGGFGQQQSRDGSLTFTSQYGVVDVASLPVISVNGAPPAAPLAAPLATPPENAGQATDIFAAIEKLADLHKRGMLSDNEFSSKKADLLSRL